MRMLDWLAAEFMKPQYQENRRPRAGDVKHLLKTIVPARPKTVVTLHAGTESAIPITACSQGKAGQGRS